MTDLNADYIRTIARQSEQLAADAEDVALEGTDRRPGALDNLMTRMRTDEQCPPPFGDVEDGERFDGQS